MKLTILLCAITLAVGCGKDDKPGVGGGDLGESPDDAGARDSGATSDLGTDASSEDLGVGDDAGIDMALDGGVDMALDGGVDMALDGGADMADAADMFVEPCGNGILEAGEACDPGIAAGAGACPTACDDGLACTMETLVGMASDCTATCDVTPVCADGDFCCVAPCNLGNDSECFVPSGMTIASRGITAASNVAIAELALGPNGRYFLGGTFQGTVDLDSTTTLTPSNSFAAAWVAEFDANDDVVWVNTAISDRLDGVVGLEYDATNDHVVATIGTLGTASIDVAGTAYSLNGLNDVVVAKFDAANSGSVEWANVYGGTDRDVSYDTVVAPDDTIWLVGAFMGTADFGQGAVTATGFDAWVAHLDTDGSTIDSWTWGGADDDSATGVVAFDDGSAAVVGGFRGTVNFGGMDLTATSGNLAQFFAVRLDDQGDHDWSRAYMVRGGPNDAAALPNGNFAVVGRSRGNPDFGDGAQQGFSDNDIVVGIIDGTNGDGLRTHVAGGTGNDYAIAVAATHDGINIVGQVEGGVDFHGNAVMSFGNSDAFVARLSPDAASSWMNVFGGADNDSANDVSVDVTYGVHVVGTYVGPVDVGTGALPSDGLTEAFVASFAP